MQAGPGASTLSSKDKEWDCLSNSSHPLWDLPSGRFIFSTRGGGVPAALVMAECSSMALQKALRKRTEKNWHVLQCGCPPAALTSGGQEAWATGAPRAPARGLPYPCLERALHSRDHEASLKELFQPLSHRSLEFLAGFLLPSAPTRQITNPDAPLLL